MSRIQARYFDGQTSRRYQVEIQIFPDRTFHIFGMDGPVQYLVDEVRISTRLGNTSRSIELPGGSRLEVSDNDALDQQLETYATRAPHWLHRLESSWHYVLLSVISLAAISWGFVVYAIPAIAKEVAFALPASIDESIGESGLELLDSMMLSPTELEPERQERMQNLFAAVATDARDEHELRLELRHGGVFGANALALPSGIVIVTDELAGLAVDDQELTAVMAHEVGHVVNRHSLRMLLQDSATAVVIVAITGDVTSLTALSATIPTALVQASFSRQFETEADIYAYGYLDRHDIERSHFARILKRLEDAYGDDGPDAFDYLSSHPRTEDRIRESDSGS